MGIDEIEDNGEITPKKNRYRGLRPPWKPGESGNPKGRPKGTVSIVEGLHRILKKRPPDAKDKKTYLDKLLKVIIKKAIEDEDVKMIIDLINRIDGKPRESISLSGIPGEPLEVKLSILEILKKYKEAFDELPAEPEDPQS